jgi:peptide/nickel transport system substrate-binding protein
MLRHNGKTRALLVGVGLLVLSGCGGGGSSSSSGGDGGGGSPASSGGDRTTLVIAIPGTPQGVDLDRQAGPQSWTMAGQLLSPGAEWARVEYPYEKPPIGDPTQVPGFTYPNLKDQDIEWQIIEKCDLSKDGKKATYHLRKGVKTFDGQEFTADDVLFRVERAIANKAIGAFMVGAANAADLKQWKKVDDHTVRITSDSAMPLICKLNTNLYWTYWDSETIKENAAADDKYGNEFVATNGASFGPYHVTSWESGKQVVMEANENYWGGAPEIKKIIWRVVPESSNRVALLKSGQVDMAEALSPEELASLDGNEGVRVAAPRSSLSIYAVMNNKKKPFNEVKVRQAINHAIPRDDIVDKVYRGLANRWEGVMPSIYPGYVEQSRYPYDIEKAKQLMSEGGYADGFKTTLSYNAGDPVQEQAAILLQTSLRQIGVQVTLQKLPPAALSDKVQSKTADFAFWLDFPIQPDPNYSLRLLYLTDNAVNYQNYSNAEVDKLIEDATPIVDAEERLKAHEEIQNRIAEDAPIAWMTEPNYLIGMRDTIEGWGWHTTQHYLVKDLTKK